MSVIDRIFPPKSPPTGPSPPPPASAPAPGGGAPVAPSDLLERRTKLAEDLATLQWDLGDTYGTVAVRMPRFCRRDGLMRTASSPPPPLSA